MRVRRSLSNLFLCTVVLLLVGCPPEGRVIAVDIDEELIALKIGESMTIRANVHVTGAASRTVEWSTSDANVARVSASGLVTALGPGVAFVTAQSHESPRFGADLRVLVLDEQRVASPYASVSQVKVLRPSRSSASDPRLVGFDLAWESSWRGDLRPSYVAAADTWDAAWVFVKFRVVGGGWQHATLLTHGHGAEAGVSIDASSDGKGAFVYRQAPGFGAFEARGVRLAWDSALDGVSEGDVQDVRVFAIEMVHVPRGSFALGTGGDEASAFRNGSSDDPFVVRGQTSLDLGAGEGQLNWSVGVDSGAPDGSTNRSFPTGYDAFYVMKHQITQGQYAAFLNTLTQAQADARVHVGAQRRYAITGEAVGSYATTLPHVAANFLSWADGAAFTDWAALRPLSELEFEKAARGPLAPVPNEYAWSGTGITAATALQDEGSIQEVPTPFSANANFDQRLTPAGPLRVGAFAADGESREGSGASYYGVMELSGNLWERTVTVGNVEGRRFAGSHGDGLLDTAGDANVATWPAADEVGAGFRGGAWYNEAAHLRVSDREFAAQVNAVRDSGRGWRAARSAP